MKSGKDITAALAAVPDAVIVWDRLNGLTRAELMELILRKLVLDGISDEDIRIARQECALRRAKTDMDKAFAEMAAMPQGDDRVLAAWKRYKRSLTLFGRIMQRRYGG